MSIQLTKSQLSWKSWDYNCFFIHPKQDAHSLAILTHGYTSHKGSILSWATRLAEEGVATALVDIPGHYLGGFNEVLDTEEFKQHAHEILIPAYNGLMQKAPHLKEAPLLLTGHSLGALVALKASENVQNFKHHQQWVVGVGLGMAPKGKMHIFDTPFYKSTLHLRGQLVSKAISPDIIFPWIKQEKENLIVQNKRIHLITGEDDVVVGEDGTERLVAILEDKNQVSLERPRKLAHHQPDMAAAHIKKFLKDDGFIK